jgi:hypothetical protein
LGKRKEEGIGEEEGGETTDEEEAVKVGL